MQRLEAEEKLVLDVVCKAEIKVREVSREML